MHGDNAFFAIRDIARLAAFFVGKARKAEPLQEREYPYGKIRAALLTNVILCQVAKVHFVTL